MKERENHNAEGSVTCDITPDIFSVYSDMEIAYE